ncbi:MAG: C45 family peptidase [Chloroflexota bacterium]
MLRFSRYLAAFYVLLIILLAVVCACTVSLPSAKIPQGKTTESGKGYRFDRNGWIYLHIEGEPYQRGHQHGYLLAPELKEIQRSLKYLTYWDTGMEWSFFVNTAEKMFVPFIDQEFLDEIKGIAEGAKAAGTDISWQEVLAWNGYSELTDYWWPTVQAATYGSMPSTDKGHCSAFIASGSYTSGGGIVVAHNSWDDYAIGQFFNVILDIQPAKGQRIIMQSSPGHIDSFTDFFVTGAGIVGTETTIGGFSQYQPNEAPEFYRVRRAMQYAASLDQFTDLMKKQNSGGYANGWLLGDIRTGEIMRFELGLKFTGIDRARDGYYIGFNAPYDPRIRNLECSGMVWGDIRTPEGARQVRLAQLMDDNRGRIDATAAQKILSDHYDVYLQKENPGSRTVEGRYDLDRFEYWAARTPYAPKGAVDGKATDSNLAKVMSLYGRWGSSSGMPFEAGKFLKEHPQYSYLDGYLKDRPPQPWTLFKADDN